MRILLTVFLLVGTFTLALGTAGSLSGTESVVRLDPDKIGQVVGVKATTSPDGVVRVGWARTDVSVKVDGVPLHPFAGLGS